MGWAQNYDPFNNPLLSALVAAIPMVLLLAIIATNKITAHTASVIAIVVAILVVVFGFGMPAGTASLGELIGQAKRNLQAPWLGLTAFFALALILSLLVFIGEACRDAFDPRS
jgi:ABC-type microcin C transport system permease subunit YejE